MRAAWGMYPLHTASLEYELRQISPCLSFLSPKGHGKARVYIYKEEQREDESSTQPSVCGVVDT